MKRKEIVIRLLKLAEVWLDKHSLDCPLCHGGKKCTRCFGRGLIKSDQKSDYITCPACKGTRKEPCPECERIISQRIQRRHYLEQKRTQRVAKLMANTDVEKLRKVLKTREGTEFISGLRFEEIKGFGNPFFKIKDQGSKIRLPNPYFSIIVVEPRSYELKFFKTDNSKYIDHWVYLAGEEKEIVDKAFNFAFTGKLSSNPLEPDRLGK